MSTQSLTQQLSIVGKDTSAPKPGQKMKNGSSGLVFSALGGHAYNNGLILLECTQKDGKKLILTVNDQTQLRITSKKDSSRNVYYYDTMFLLDSCVYGIKSRVLRIKDKIPVKDISKIEVLSPASDKRYVR
jgi:hypothetical protein